MTKSTLSLLDQAELLQLASNAGTSDDPGAAIGYLKEAVSRGDASAIAHFMLGAEYAEIKMYDRAVDEMEAAIALDPALSIARFQLGLLWLTNGVPDKAVTVLEPLDELVDGDPLRLFGRGLRHLIKDEFADCIDCLTAGIANNTVNAALNQDMAMLAEQVREVMARAAEAAPEQSPEEPAADEPSHHVLLSAYTGNTSH